MSEQVVLLHNPRCSKSRATLALLQEQGHEPEIREYLHHPLDAAELDKLGQMLGLSPREFMRKGQSEYKDNDLDNEQLSRADLLNAMAEHPILMERPVVIFRNQAAIGRPPENVLTIL